MDVTLVDKKPEEQIKEFAYLHIPDLLQTLKRVWNEGLCPLTHVFLEAPWSFCGLDFGRAFVPL